MKLTIGDLEQLTGINRTTLRYYDAEELVDPERTDTGYRVYSHKDIINVVQVRQLSAFGIELSHLPSKHNHVTCREMQQTLAQKAQEMEQQIEELYTRLGRLRLHADAYRQALEEAENSVVTESKALGAYRLFFRPGAEMDPDTMAIAKRWMNLVPDTYPVVRIPRSALALAPGAECPTQVGLGLLSSAFHRYGEQMQPPMEHTPPCRCLHAMLCVKNIDAIPRRALDPFQQYLDAHSLIPLGDFYGWIVYSPIKAGEESWRVSVRIGIG